jgi:hypothetical protein
MAKRLSQKCPKLWAAAVSGFDQHQGIEAALEELIRAHAGPGGLIQHLLPHRHKIEEALKAGLSASKIAGAIQHALGDQYAMSSIRKAIPLVASRATKTIQKPTRADARNRRRASSRQPAKDDPAVDQNAPTRVTPSEYPRIDTAENQTHADLELFSTPQDEQTLSSRLVRMMTDGRVSPLHTDKGSDI